MRLWTWKHLQRVRSLPSFTTLNLWNSRVPRTGVRFFGTMPELFDLLDESGTPLNKTKPRSEVHRDGDWHRSVHVWLLNSKGELLLQKRHRNKDSFPSLWDVSCAGHLSAGDTSIQAAIRELEEELSLRLPAECLEYLFTHKKRVVLKEGTFIDNEYQDVFLITLGASFDPNALILQATEVEDAKWEDWKTVEDGMRKTDGIYVPRDLTSVQYGKFFDILRARREGKSPPALASPEYPVGGKPFPPGVGCKELQCSTDDNIDSEERLRGIVSSYEPAELGVNLTMLSGVEKQVLQSLLKAADIVDDLFLHQQWPASVPLVRVASATLKGHKLRGANVKGESDASLLWAKAVLLNKGPWSVLDGNKSFTNKGAKQSFQQPHLASRGLQNVDVVMPVPGVRPAVANYYPIDMTEEEWKSTVNRLKPEERKVFDSFYTMIRRKETIARLGKEAELVGESFDTENSAAKRQRVESKEEYSITPAEPQLITVPFHEMYQSDVQQIVKHLSHAAGLTDNPSLKEFLVSRSVDLATGTYHQSEKHWLQLDSPIDVTMGPYEVYMDEMNGLKSSFETFIGLKDQAETDKLKTIAGHLRNLEQNLPMDDRMKNPEVPQVARIRVMNLLYATGDTAGPMTVAFSLPNDEEVVKEHGTVQVMMKNVMEAKVKKILVPIAKSCLAKADSDRITFDSFFTHTLCHELCHCIGPHTIIVDGRETTVRLQLQDIHSALEEAKADVVGLWAMAYLLKKKVLPSSLAESMYASFLAGCIRSVRFGVHEAHGKGQALAFNFLLERGAFQVHEVDSKLVTCVNPNVSVVEEAVEALARTILEIQGKGDKTAALALMNKYATLTGPLNTFVERLKEEKLPTDIWAQFTSAKSLVDGLRYAFD